ncbi:MAG: hypothetical protein H6839_08835 [Planctomycetes bacterium]|nr:hypothetical protein [Planctomycetota bacterium]
MLRRMKIMALAVASLITIGVLTPSHETSQNAPAKESGDPLPKAPVRNWGDWWPETQFGEDDSVTTDQIRAGDRTFERVVYGAISTPWNGCLANFSHSEAGDGLRFDLLWSRPGDFASKEEKDAFKSPKQGDIRAAIVRGDKVIAEPTNGEPAISAWAGGSLGMTGDMMIFFDWLPADFEDYWIRVDMLKERHWFLIPYGLGSNPKENAGLELVERGGPEQPQAAQKADRLHLWNSVGYELGWVKEEGWHVSASVSNPFDTEIRIHVYEDGARWELSYPRTSAVYNWPAGYSRFCSWTSISRADSIDYSRTDTFKFWRTPFDTRNWGLLRVTVEDHAFDKVVPSSLFNYTHNWLEKK